MTNDVYKALDIKSAIQTRPGMYIGSTETADHLATEIIDNTLDEIANGHASACHVQFGDDGSCWVTDNGRGMAVYNMSLPNGEEKDSVEALCTELHSGAKFDNNEYGTLIGMHGVGLVVTNALSDWLVVKTRGDRNDRSRVFEYTFMKGDLVSKTETSDPNDDGSWSTMVGFKPTSSFFDNSEFDMRNFVDRLILTQAKFPSAIFTINGKPIPKFEFIEYVRRSLQLEDEPIFSLQHEINQNQKILVYLTYSYNQTTVVMGDVNLRVCDGTYLTSFQTILKNMVSDKLDKKKFKNVPDNLLTLGLRLFISLTVPEPTFDSQTKTRMTLNVREELILPLVDQIKWFLDRPSIMDQIQANIESKLKQKIVKKISRTTGQFVSAKNKLRDCINRPGDILYILEGDSALGTLKQARDPDTEAIFPLRGKVLNVETSSLDQIQKNEEIKYLIEALGPKSNRRYDKIKIIADADPDGWHIVVLVILLLQKFADDYIKAGKVSVVLPPLYGAVKGNQYIPIYSYDSKLMDQYRSQKFDIIRFKGLGEMSPERLEISIRSGIEKVLEWPENQKQLDALISMVTDTDIKRALVNNDRCTFERVLEDVLTNKVENTEQN